MAKINKHYVSEIDQFLSELEKNVSQSPSQLEEIATFRRLNELRDNPHAKQPKDLFDF